MSFHATQILAWHSVTGQQDGDVCVGDLAPLAEHIHRQIGHFAASIDRRTGHRTYHGRNVRRYAQGCWVIDITVDQHDAGDAFLAVHCDF